MSQEFSAMRISPHFVLAEFEKSPTAAACGIDNRVPTRYVPNVVALVNEVLEPVRSKLGIEIYISSGYRCKAVNAKNHGAAHSQHMKGEAADIYISSDPKKNLGYTLWDVLKLIVNITDFDQIIWETRPPTKARPNGSKWIHVSYVTYRKNRHSMLRCADGKTYKELEI